MPECVPYITWIAQVTLKFVNYTLLVYNRRFFLLHFKFLFDLVANENRLNEEGDRLRVTFSWLKYPQHLINTTIRIFVASKAKDQQPMPALGDSPTVRIVLPFKDQVSADFVRKQLKDLSQKTHTAIQPVFVSNKIEQKLKVQEKKPPIVDQQCVAYKFQCDLCDASYVGVHTQAFTPVRE